MPYKSKAQERWAHTDEGKKALGKSTVAEFDAASKGKKLPEKIKKKKNIDNIKNAMLDIMATKSKGKK